VLAADTAYVQDDIHQENDAFWSQTYMELVREAEQKLLAAEKEASILPSRTSEDRTGDQGLEIKVHDLSLVGKNKQSGGTADGDVTALGGEELIPDRLPKIENVFSSRLVATDVKTKDLEEMSSEGDDEVGDLPSLPHHPKSALGTGLPTPPTSSRPGSVQPE